MGLGTRCMIFAAVLLVAVSATAQAQCPKMPSDTLGPCTKEIHSGEDNTMHQKTEDRMMFHNV
ncbi:Protein of unknown function [Gryllus bimaculatus]|nr:Protein of unknown function [Gryllus bimaculatus]